MSERGWIVLGIANIPFNVGIGWLFFKTWADFGESIGKTPGQNANCSYG